MTKDERIQVTEKGLELLVPTRESFIRSLKKIVNRATAGQPEIDDAALPYMDGDNRASEV